MFGGGGSLAPVDEKVEWGLEARIMLLESD